MQKEIGDRGVAADLRTIINIIAVLEDVVC